MRRMSDYTIKNLRAVDDAAAGRDLSEVQEARFAMGALDAEATGLCLQRVKPTKRQAFAHRHDQAEEIYVVISGHGRVKLDDDVRDVGPMDAIRVAPAVVRSFEASDEGLELLVFGPHHSGDGELIQDDVWAGHA
jgi:mannose-6-phosphate isomerase-like protein (cupin superfamily)